MSLYPVGLLWMIIVREIALILFLHILVKTFSTIPFSSVFLFCVSSLSIYFRNFLCRGGWGPTVQNETTSSKL